MHEKKAKQNPDDKMSNTLVVKVKTNLASLYRDQGNYDKAEAIFIQALAMAKEKLGANDTTVAMVLHSYAELLRDTNRKAEAEKMESRCLYAPQQPLSHGAHCDYQSSERRLGQAPSVLDKAHPYQLRLLSSPNCA